MCNCCQPTLKPISPRNIHCPINCVRVCLFSSPGCDHLWGFRLDWQQEARTSDYCNCGHKTSALQSNANLSLCVVNSEISPSWTPTKPYSSNHDASVEQQLLLVHLKTSVEFTWPLHHVSCVSWWFHMFPLLPCRCAHYLSGDAIAVFGSMSVYFYKSPLSQSFTSSFITASLSLTCCSVVKPLFPLSLYKLLYLAFLKIYSQCFVKHTVCKIKQFHLSFFSPFIVSSESHIAQPHQLNLSFRTWLRVKLRYNAVFGVDLCETNGNPELLLGTVWWWQHRLNTRTQTTAGAYRLPAVAFPQGVCAEASIPHGWEFAISLHKSNTVLETDMNNSNSKIACVIFYYDCLSTSNDHLFVVQIWKLAQGFAFRSL